MLCLPNIVVLSKTISQDGPTEIRTCITGFGREATGWCPEICLHCRILDYIQERFDILHCEELSLITRKRDSTGYSILDLATIQVPLCQSGNALLVDRPRVLCDLVDKVPPHRSSTVLVEIRIFDGKMYAAWSSL